MKCDTSKTSLLFEPDAFGGEIIDTNDIGSSADEFGQRLGIFVEEAKKRGSRVAWLTLDTSRALMIPVALEAGFLFHHASGSSAQLTLSLTDKAYVPPYATHYIGAGGVVLRDPDTMLVVVERYGRRTQKHYKLPGGALQPGEHIEQAVVREVREETGIEARFETLNCFRHWHNYRYGKSDIYFVCKLHALTHEISRQEEEIEECMWMPIEEYLDHPNVHVFNKSVARAVLGADGLGPRPIDGYGTPESHELFMPVAE